MSGELPPPPPRTLFGRGELIEKVIHSAKCLTPIALIGAGGIGKSSIVLTALHDGRIKQQFDDNRWFIRCDQFPPSRTHFLRRLSAVVGAGVENPKDLIPLRRHLSSKEMVIVLDNAESILDPQQTSSREICAIVNELSQFSNICVIITSRISTIPPHFETIDIQTLSTEAAHDAFYHIYRRSERSDSINNILKQLDCHPLSITLLATAAQHNQWDIKRLTAEWEGQRTGVLHAQHFRSLATTIELSLASPTFQELGPDARGLLGVVAFFPQGVNEDNADRLFPTTSGRRNMLDKFCTLSLTYRSNGFIAMLAPLRDYLRPKDLMSSQLLRITKECYFTWLSADATPGKSNLDESRLVTSEDANVEHLLDVFTSIDVNSENVWDACTGFMEHLYWHNPRLVVLGPKIEALPDDHPSKARCLRGLARLFSSVGHWVEQKRILTRTLEFWREKGDEYQVAQTLSMLCDANRLLDLEEEGIQQGREASEILGRLGNTTEQAECLIALAWVLHDDDQLDAAEDAASRAIDLLQKEDEQLNVCHCHRVLGEVYHSKGESEKAIHHFEVALETASSTNWHTQLFGLHFSLAQLFSREHRSYEAHTHLEHAKAQAADDPYLLARALWLQAWIMNDMCTFEEAKSEALRALDTFEELGATNDVEMARNLLTHIDSNARRTDLGLAAAGSDN
jgi:tetratricopeptide (TPR) repeat protein